MLAVLADGMGGMHGGREASQTAVRRMMDAYAGKTQGESIPQALVRALVAANAAVYQLAVSREGEGEVGTTLVAAVVHGEELFWIGAGDSRLYHLRAEDDSLIPCTDDHTHAKVLLERVARGELSQAQAQAEAATDGAALVSFLGLHEVPEIDRSLKPRRLRPGDRLLLCSDGVYNTLPEPDIALLLRHDAQAAAEALIQAVRERAGPTQDNATAVVIAMGDSPKAGAVPLAKTEPRTAQSDAHAAAEAARPAPKHTRAMPLVLGLGALLLLALGIGIGVFVGPLVPQPSEQTPTAQATTDDRLAPERSRNALSSQVVTPEPANAAEAAPQRQDAKGVAEASAGEQLATAAAGTPDGPTPDAAAKTAGQPQSDESVAPNGTVQTQPETPNSVPAAIDPRSAPAAAP